MIDVLFVCDEKNVAAFGMPCPPRIHDRVDITTQPGQRIRGLVVDVTFIKEPDRQFCVRVSLRREPDLIDLSERPVAQPQVSTKGAHGRKDV